VIQLIFYQHQWICHVWKLVIAFGSTVLVLSRIRLRQIFTVSRRPNTFTYGKIKTFEK
jgi:hypothetical protein